MLPYLINKLFLPIMNMGIDIENNTTISIENLSNSTLLDIS